MVLVGTSATPEIRNFTHFADTMLLELFSLQMNDNLKKQIVFDCSPAHQTHFNIQQELGLAMCVLQRPVYGARVLRQIERCHRVTISILGSFESKLDQLGSWWPTVFPLNSHLFSLRILRNLGTGRVGQNGQKRLPFLHSHCIARQRKSIHSHKMREFGHSSLENALDCVWAVFGPLNDFA